MPVKAADGSYVSFIYSPSYMKDKDGSFFKKYKDWQPLITTLLEQVDLEVKHCKLCIDGGNVELYGSKAIVSDRVFRDNAGTDENHIIEHLKRALKVKDLIIVPQYPYDFTGHVDGLVRFIDEDTVLINDYTEELKAIEDDSNDYRRKLLDQWHHSFRNTLYNAGLEIETLPCGVEVDQPDRSAEGIHLNFLLLPDLIIMPEFSASKTNDKAKQRLEELYKRIVIGIESTDLAQEGGIINCVTWSR
jgi:agmatine deiminase